MDRKRIAFFIPGRGCGRRCVYCDQFAITRDGGGGRPLTPEAVRNILSGCHDPVELCFFGGSFARAGRESFVEFLESIWSAPPGSSITFSSYPGDFNGQYGGETARILKNYPIGTIELGIPSLDPDVLRKCGRDDDPDDALGILAMLRDMDFNLGVQVMIGLPSQSRESSRGDLNRIASVMGGRVWDFRLYPCLVLKGTELEAMYGRGEYRPLELEDAVRTGGRLLLEAESLGFNVIRVGLLDSRSLRESVVSGPYHPAFGELALSEKTALSMSVEHPSGPWQIDARHISRMTGHGGRGIKRLSELTGLPASETAALLQVVRGGNQ
ncbi:MAG: radical SAM protein [Synergistaceae bacterium]|jgi:histone acetyltransferase (RNA polymerase elongator complex component)|nr:radical SAM protein [Synergistaceae bacterium]